MRGVCVCFHTLYSTLWWYSFDVVDSVFIFNFPCTSAAANQTHISVGRHATIQRHTGAVRETKTLISSWPQVSMAVCF